MLWRDILENLSLIDTLPRLSSEPFIPLWSDEYWDGPIAGVCIYKTTLFYFQAPFDYGLDEYSRPRPYCLISLTDEDIKFIFIEREEFEQYVSSNGRYILRATQVERSRDKYSHYYDNRKNFDLQDKEVFGVFYLDKWIWQDTSRWNKEASEQN